MTKANEYGFLPGNGAEENMKILQSLVDLGGEIVVEKKGVYDLTGTLEIGDHTTLRFMEGITVRRQRSKSGRTGILMINKGLPSASYNTDISIYGLHIDCNGVESDDAYADSLFVGFRAHIGFLYIKNLIIEDYECVGVLKEDYGIQISAFENIRLEKLYVEGDKDGVHLGWGKGFVIRHAKFCTFDDPIALNAYDYAPSNAHVGWIEDGLIEDCYDLPAESTTGHFCRILGGAWRDWYQGMKIQHSDTVCYDGRIYRAVMRPDGNFALSLTPPTHRNIGKTEKYDTIDWVCVRLDAAYDCGCRNIVFRDIHLQKERDRAMQIALNYDAWARSYYEGCRPVPQGNFTFERVYIENKINFVLYSNYPSENIVFKDTDLKKARIGFESVFIEGLCYPTVKITLDNVICNENSVWSDGKHKAEVEIKK